MGTGVLPISFHKGKIYFYFQENGLIVKKMGDYGVTLAVQKIIMKVLKKQLYENVKKNQIKF